MSTTDDFAVVQKAVAMLIGTHGEPCLNLTGACVALTEGHAAQLALSRLQPNSDLPPKRLPVADRLSASTGKFPNSAWPARKASSGL